MTPKEVKRFYKSGYNFWKQTGMSQSTFHTWIRQKTIPELAQFKLEVITGGELKSSWTLDLMGKTGA